MALPKSRGDREYKKFTEIKGTTSVNVNLLNQLVPEKYDKIELGYTGEDLTTVTYKLNSEEVCSLGLTYDTGKLISVEKS